MTVPDDIADSFPAWEQSADKGDVIRAIIYLRGPIIHLTTIAKALKENDSVSFNASFAKLLADLNLLQGVLEDISGRTEDAE